VDSSEIALNIYGFIEITASHAMVEDLIDMVKNNNNLHQVQINTTGHTSACSLDVGAPLFVIGM
jgi:secreted trypsin-like serine protease